MDEDPDNVIVREQPLFFGKRQFRAPFKVDIVSWNPYAELVALASKKGDVVLKRSGWKKCWRISVSNVVDSLAAANSEDQRSIECLSWSPCGDLLAIGMSDGHFHLVEVDHGNVRWTKLISDPSGVPVRIVNLRWFPHSPGGSGFFTETKVTDEAKAMAQLGEDDREWNASSKELENVYKTKLKGTLLFAWRDDLKISVLAGGIVTVAVIDLSVSLSFLNLLPMTIYDLMYSTLDKSVTIAVTTYGPKPHCGGDGVFGVPVVPEGADTLPHTHLVHIPLRFRDESATWQMVERYVRLFSRYTNVVETLNAVVKDWGTQKQIFVNRLTPAARNLELGVTLVTFCIGGGAHPIGEAYIEKTLAAGLNGMREFAETFFNNILVGIRGPFGDAIRSLSFHLEQFKMKLAQLSTKENYSADDILFPKRNTNIHVYPYESRVGADPPMDEFSTKIRSLSEAIDTLCVSLQKTVLLSTQASIGNMRELLLLVRWISIFPQLMKHTKKGMAAMGQSGKVKVKSLVELLIATFVEDPNERMILETYCNSVDVVVQAEIDREERSVLNAPRNVPTPVRTEVAGPSTSPGTPLARMRYRTTDNESGEPFWHTNMDKVSEMWVSPREFSDQLLKMLGPSLPPLSGDPTPSNSNVAQQIESLKKLMRNADAVLEYMCIVHTPDWLYELASGADHRGFTRVQLSPMSWYNNALSSGMMEMFKKRERQQLSSCFRGSICVAFHDEVAASYRIILPKNSGHRFSGVQDDLAVDLKTGGKMLAFTDGNQENMATEPGALTVEIPKEEYGQIIKIHDFHIHTEGFFFALVTTKSETQGELRRFLQGHPLLKNEFNVHDTPFRHDQFESMAFTSANMFGSIVSDEATRISTFATSPLEESNTEEKTREAEEYRRLAAERERASRPPEPAFFHVYDGNKVLRVQADE